MLSASLRVSSLRSSPCRPSRPPVQGLPVYLIRAAAALLMLSVALPVRSCPSLTPSPLPSFAPGACVAPSLRFSAFSHAPCSSDHPSPACNQAAAPQGAPQAPPLKRLWCAFAPGLLSAFRFLRSPRSTRRVKQEIPGCSQKNGFVKCDLRGF